MQCFFEWEVHIKREKDQNSIQYGYVGNISLFLCGISSMQNNICSAIKSIFCLLICLICCSLWIATEDKNWKWYLSNSEKSLFMNLNIIIITTRAHSKIRTLSTNGFINTLQFSNYFYSGNFLILTWSI